MFSLLAFKSIDVREDGLWSPKFQARWDMEDTPWGRFPVLRAKPGDVEAGFGVHAGVWFDAISYCGKMHLVAPHPDYEVVEGEAGWRAGAAICIGSVESLGREAIGNTILAAARAGYPQINDIVAWAAYITYDADALIESGAPHWMYRAGVAWPIRRWDERITEALIKTGAMFWIFRACEDWPREVWSPALAEAVAEDAFWRYEALVYWPGERAEVVRSLAKK